MLAFHAIVRRSNASEVHYVTDVSFRKSLEGLKTGADLDTAQSIAKVGNGVCTTDLAEIEKICREQIEHSVEDSKPLWPWFLFAASPASPSAVPCP